MKKYFNLYFHIIFITNFPILLIFNFYLSDVPYF